MTDDTRGLTRRQVLGSVGTVGGAAAIGGASSLAFFSDDEEFANNRLVAGSLDLKIAWQENYFGAEAEAALEAGAFAPRHFLDAPETTLEAFPQATTVDQLADECRDAQLYADTPAALDPTVSQRPLNEDTYDSAAGRPRPLIFLQDAKPGDFGFVRFRLLLCGNPGYIWQTGGIRSLADNGTTEPERKDSGQETGAQAAGGELAETIKVRLFQFGTGIGLANVFGTLGDSLSGAELSRAVFDLFSIESGVTLARFSELLASERGIPLHGDPFDGSGAGTALNSDLFLYDLERAGQQDATERKCFEAAAGTDNLGIVWGLPVDHANEIQTDSVAVDVGYYVEQCRHNDGSGMAGMGNTSG